MTSFFGYSGSKLNYSNLINSKISIISTNKKVYIEPFVGSGAILFNLDKQFEHYIINDIDRNIIRMYKSFKGISYTDYENSLDYIKDKFGSIKTSKESYYNFRNWFNETYYNTDTIEEGLYLHSLTNSCINSMLRFGPNGMNQSYGNRFFTLDFPNFERINHILQRTEILNTSYKDVLDNDGFFFFDPPYFSRDAAYTGFSKEDAKEFIELIKYKVFLYTDIQNEFNKNLYKMEIRTMQNTAPSSKKEKTNKEYLFSSKSLDAFDW